LSSQNVHTGNGADDAGRDQLAEANRLNEEIAEAMGSIQVGAALDETELEDELEELQQQEIEHKMLNTGAVAVDRLPTVANGESKLIYGPAAQSGCANPFL
jgi:charged multivesicular body protein 4